MYYNPVKVIETDDWYHVLQETLTKLNVKYPLVVTSGGNIERNNF